MDEMTRAKAVQMAKTMFEDGKSFFERVCAIRSFFRLDLLQAKEVILDAEDGQRRTLSDRQGDILPALEAALEVSTAT